MSEPINWKALAWKLARPWWGPHAPSDYVVTYQGQKAGIGLLHDYNFGAWNLLLAARRTFELPATRDEHANLVPMLIACRQLAAHPIEGQPLGSYATLMGVSEFQRWFVGEAEKKKVSLPNKVQIELIRNLSALARLEQT